MHLGLPLYSKGIPTQAFSSEICNNFWNIYFEEHLCTTASECHYNRGKIIRNTSSSCKDCFLGAVKSDKKGNIFLPLVWKFRTIWLLVVLVSCSCFWLMAGFDWLWVVLAGLGWLWVVLAHLDGCLFYN